jgi:hypothetical protein
LEGGGFIDILPRTEVKHKIKEKEKKNAHNRRALAYVSVLSMKKIRCSAAATLPVLQHNSAGLRPAGHVQILQADTEPLERSVRILWPQQFL